MRRIGDAAKRPMVRLLGRFRADRRGVTAIEFGIIAAPLFGLIFAILQSSLAFLMQQGLRTALDYAARQVLTGEAQSNAAIIDGASFRDQLICSKSLLPTFMTCSNIVVDVRAASSFSVLGAGDVNSSFMPDGAQYVSGQPCQIMVVRAAYPMPSFLPLISWGDNYKFLNNLTGLTTYKGSLVKMLSAAAVFRSEPYGSTNCTS